MARTRSDDDLLEDLPPLDDGEEDQDRGQEAEEELDSGLDDGGTDDEVASDLPIGELLDPIRDEGVLDAEDARELDVGTTDTVEDQASSRDDDDMSGVPGEDLSIGVDDLPDQGAEDLEGDSPGTEAEVIDESALPAMDADDDGQEGIELEPIDLPEEVALPRWSALRWEQVPLPLVAEPMKLVAVRGARVIAAGQEVLELDVDPDGTLHVLPCPSPPLPTLLTGLAVPDDGPPVVTGDGHEEGSNLVAFGPEHALLAKLTADGVLKLSRDHGQTWVDVQKQDEVAGVCVDAAGGLVAAVASGNARGLLRSSDGLGFRLGRSASEAQVPWRRPVFVAARDGSVAVATSAGGIDLSLNEGADWSQHAVPRWLTSIAFVPAAGVARLVGTLFLESEDKSYLFSVEPEGTVTLIADLSPAVGVSGEDDDSEGMGRAECVAWDEARGWLWVAGRFGLQAWRPALAA